MRKVLKPKSIPIIPRRKTGKNPLNIKKNRGDHWMRGTTIFNRYLDAPSLFTKNREVLRPSYLPEKLPHREVEIEQLASVMSTALRGGRPSNVIIFGKTGTGKTAVIRYLAREIKRTKELVNSDVLDMPELEYIYINCEIVDTPYGILQNIGNRFIDDFSERIPFTGWPLEKVYDMLRKKLDEKERIVTIVLDELDKLVYKSGDDVLYHLTKINDDLVRSKLSIIGISNDLKFMEFLDPRVKSRLSEEKMVFPPYNAAQLSDILRDRISLAFNENVVEDGVVELCAALAAQEHGDARRALDLLRVAGEIAERSADSKVREEHVYKAKNKIELDCIAETIRTLPLHSKLILLSIILHEENGRRNLTTGEVYTAYKELCSEMGLSPLTQRRITDLISELDMLGLINARVKSFGRGGRTKEIQSSVPSVDAKKILLEDDNLEGFKEYSLKQTYLH